MNPSEGTRIEIAHKLKNTIDTYKEEALSWSRYFLRLDLQLRQRLAMGWLSFKSAEFSSSIAWISIFILLIAFIYILKAPEIAAYFQARSLNVTIEWNPNCPNRVGGLVDVKICMNIGPRDFNYMEFYEPEAMYDVVGKIGITVKLGDELLIVEKVIDEANQCIHAKFQASLAGTYHVHVTFRGHEVKGSPFSATLDPDALDSSKSYVGCSTPIIIVKGQQFKLDVIPIDPFGNRCATSLDNMSRLKFIVRKWDKKLSDETKSNDELKSSDDFKISVGMRRQNPEEPKILPIYSIYGNCLGVGRYIGSVFFGNEMLSLPTPELEIICVTLEENERIHKILSVGSCKFSGQKITPITESCDDDMTFIDVGIHVSSRFLWLSIPILGPHFDYRSSTWRIGDHTNLDILSVFNDQQQEKYILRISDVNRNAHEDLMINGTNARVLISLFHEFTSQKLNDESHFNSFPKLKSGCDFGNLEVKRQAFFETIRQSYDVDQTSPNAYKILKVKRTSIVETSLEETRLFSRQDWGKPFIVSFFNEPVKEGMAWLEWAKELLDTFFENNAHGMFFAKSNTAGIRRRPGLIHPNPGRNARWGIEHYEFAGKLLGKILMENATFDYDNKGTLGDRINVDARFSRTLLATILKVDPTYRHLELDDPNEFKSTFETVLNNDVSHMELKFVSHVYDQFGNLEIIDLIPEGHKISVTNHNKLEYLNALAKFHLVSNVREELEAFVSGLNFLAPDEALMMFDENELELMICGSTPLNLEDLKFHHESVGDWNPSFSRVKENLWKALENMNELELGRFYQFLTGSSRLPKEGFKELMPSISLSALFGQLPTANRTTCHISLTDHASPEAFVAKLRLAIKSNSLET